MEKSMICYTLRLSAHKKIKSPLSVYMAHSYSLRCLPPYPLKVRFPLEQPIVIRLPYVCCDQSCPTLCNSIDYSPPGSSVHEGSPGKNTTVGCHALLQGDLPKPRIEPRSPALQVDSLPSEPPGKPRLLRACSKMLVFVVLVFCSTS